MFSASIQAIKKINNEKDLADIDKFNAKSTEWFAANEKLFNVHVELHLSYFAKKYETLMNCNVLSEESKHM